MGRVGPKYWRIQNGDGNKENESFAAGVKMTPQVQGAETATQAQPYFLIYHIYHFIGLCDRKLYNLLL